MIFQQKFCRPEGSGTIYEEMNRKNQEEKKKLYPSKVLFQINGNIKSFTDKKKLKELSTIKPTLHMLKELLYVEGKKKGLN